MHRLIEGWSEATLAALANPAQGRDATVGHLRLVGPIQARDSFKSRQLSWLPLAVSDLGGAGFRVEPETYRCFHR